MSLLLQPRVAGWSILLALTSWVISSTRLASYLPGWVAIVLGVLFATAGLLSALAQVTLRQPVRFHLQDAFLLWLLYGAICLLFGVSDMLQPVGVWVGMFWMGTAALERALGAPWGIAVLRGAAGIFRCYWYAPWTVLTAGVMCLFPYGRSVAMLMALALVFDRHAREAGSGRSPVPAVSPQPDAAQ